MTQPEFIDRFREFLPTGKQTWSNKVGLDLIKGVSQMPRPFYTQMIPSGLSQVPGLSDLFAGEIRVLGLACGARCGSDSDGPDLSPDNAAECLSICLISWADPEKYRCGRTIRTRCHLSRVHSRTWIQSSTWE